MTVIHILYLDLVDGLPNGRTCAINLSIKKQSPSWAWGCR